MNLLMKRLSANVTLPSMAVPCSSSAHAKVLAIPFSCRCRRSSRSLLVLGAVHSYWSLLVCRFFLDALEGIIHRHPRPSSDTIGVLSFRRPFLLLSTFSSAMLCNSALLLCSTLPRSLAPSLVPLPFTYSFLSSDHVIVTQEELSL
jgi:hypothetical protein